MTKTPVALALLTLLLTACPARTPVVPDPTAASTASPAPSPNPTTTKRALPVATRVAYIAEDGLSLYDVKADTVQQVLRGSGIRQPRFLNRDTIAFVRDEGTGSTISTYDVRTRAVTTLHTTDAPIRVWAARPDNEELAYIVVGDDAYPQVRFRSLVGNQTTLVVTTLARALGREADLSDQMLLRYAPDGARVLISFSPADGEPGQKIPDSAAQMQVRALDGALEFAPPHAQDATQAVLSTDGKRVTYMRASGPARVWDAATGKVSQLRGAPARWFNPAPSLEGRTIAYDTGATSVKVRVEILDVRTGTRTALGPAGRANPVFANSRTVWMQSVQPCEPDCLLPVTPGPEVYAVDMRTGAERKLKIPTLQDIAISYA